MNYKISLHSHTSDFVYLIGTLSKKEPYARKLISYLFKKIKDNERLVLGITNFNNDERYESLFKIIRKLEYNIDSSYQETFFSISRLNKTIYFIKTDEIETNKGHILIVGYNGKMKSHNLKEILKQAHNQNCIIIASHPLHEFLVPHFLIGSVSLDKRTILRNRESIDGLELNSYFKSDWNKIKELSKKDKIPLVSDSDAHFMNEILTSFFETSYLNFSNPDKFKQSLKLALKKGIKLHAKAHNLTAEYKHILQILAESAGKYLGILRSE